MRLEPIDQTVVCGAAILTRRGVTVPVYVEMPEEFVACWFLYACGGGVMVSRQADGRESNFPVPLSRVLVEEETAALCREAEEARALAAQYVVRASGRVNNGRSYGWRSVRGRQ